ncbi:hypothetical protein ACLB2K_038598 [Fragaria x ananassa]
MAVPAYPMSIFLLPITLCKALNSDISNFWWGFSDSKDKLHWKAWDSLCKRKLEGGIGFKDLHTYNKALLTKQCWKLINRPNSLWGKIMKARYFPNSNFLKAKKGSRPSWVWNSLLAGRETISEYALWQINSTWKKCGCLDRYRWVPNSNRGLIKPIITSNRFTALAVADVIDEDRNWNISHIEPFLEKNDATTIKAIPIGNADDDDALVWPHLKSGNYSIKSGYHKLLEFQKKLHVSYSPDRGRISHLEEWLLEIHKNAGMFSCEREDVLNLVCLHLWEIWKHRCSVVMRISTPNPSLVIENIQRGILNWEEARMSMTQPSQSIPRPISLWVPPLVNMVKINFDGAWKESNHNSGLGVIIRRHIGDCQEVIKALNESLASPCWRISHILKKVAHLVPLFKMIHWNWVPREVNRLANAAAKLAIQSLCSQ